MVSDKPGGDKSAGVSINFCSEDPAMYVEYNFFISFFGAATTVVAFRIVQRIKANKKFRQSVQTTIGEASACKDSPSANAIIRVHVLQVSSPNQAVGLEILTERLGFYRVSSMTLSQAEATKLGSLLQSAAGNNQKVPTAK